MSKIEVDAIEPQSGTSLTIGASGDTVNIVGTLQNNGSAVGGGTQAFDAGTVSLPSITTTGDTNTGIFFPSADTIAFTEGGTESMRIDSSGNVGIGTGSPAFKLEVNKGSAGDIARFTDGVNANTVIKTSGSVTTFGPDTNNSLALQTNNTERMRITSDGRLQLATTSNMPYGADQVRFSFEFNSSAAPYYGIEMKDNGSAGTTYGILFSRSSLIGSISYNASTVSYNTTSDYRLKNNISDVLNAIDRVKQLKPIRFNFISEPNKTVDGFLAHEVQEVVPEAIVGEKDAVKTYIDDDGNEQTRPFYQGIDQSKLVPLLTAGLQEAIAKIETLEARITALENA
jgi:hypothetical protein